MNGKFLTIKTQKDPSSVSLHCKSNFKKFRWTCLQLRTSEKKTHTVNLTGFLSDLGVKNPPANTGDTGVIPGSGRVPWRKKRQPTLVFLPRKSHRWRSLAGYSPWGRKRVRPDLGTELCLVAQLCLTLCGPLDCKLSGSPIHVIFQARILVIR